ncbi:acyltransferase [Serratia sp. AKBS12]|uniref:acyltransferase family protein n=1 Tax=Serratia sp. AKBS12 TaxID=2974597 RepID=UPI0021650000|nr:acyltransferase [Serratia sp. AKBS12]MCS3409701.1 acyltransferase [Serratia sp. AKBS12]
MKRLELLDYARHFAALMVVLFHYTFNGINNGKVYTIDFIPGLTEITKYGYLGVDLFFMISGYVIFYSAKNRSAAKFAASRVIRLYPAYWFAVIFTATFAYFLGGESMSVNIKTVLVNLTMLQSMLGVSDVDGVYWTLIFELKFYLLIFALLFIGLQNQLEKIIIGWAAVIVASYFIGIGEHVYMGGYYCFFVSGALFAMLKERFSFTRLIMLAALYIIGTLYMINRRELSGHGSSSESFIILAVITIFYLFFFLQNTTTFGKLKLKGSKLAGALTYPIYLIHAHFGYMMLNKFATNENKVYVYVLLIASVYLIATLIHFIIEKRLSSVWKSLFAFVIEKPVAQTQLYFDTIKHQIIKTKEKA